MPTQKQAQGIVNTAILFDILLTPALRRRAQSMASMYTYMLIGCLITPITHLNDLSTGHNKLFKYISMYSSFIIV